MHPASNLAFYQAASTLIPVFVLALMFQARYLGRDEPSATEHRAGAFASLAVIALAIAGEIAALHVLSTGRPSETSHRTIVYALGFLGFAFWIATIARVLAPAPPHDASSRDKAIAVALVVIGLGVLAGVMIAG